MELIALASRWAWTRTAVFPSAHTSFQWSFRLPNADTHGDTHTPDAHTFQSFVKSMRPRTQDLPNGSPNQESNGYDDTMVININNINKIKYRSYPVRWMDGWTDRCLHILHYIHYTHTINVDRNGRDHTMLMYLLCWLYTYHMSWHRHKEARHT